MNSKYGKAIKVIKDIKKNGTRSLMSFYLMKSTKDDESEFSKQGQFHIDFSPFRAKCTEQQNKLPRKAGHPLFPRGSGLINEIV